MSDDNFKAAASLNFWAIVMHVSPIFRKGSYCRCQYKISRWGFIPYFLLVNKAHNAKAFCGLDLGDVVI